MASPYSGLDEETLLEIKLNLIKILSGKRLVSQSQPGLSYGRRVDSLEDARKELVLVQDAILALNPDTAPVDRVYMRAT